MTESAGHDRSPTVQAAAIGAAGLLGLAAAHQVALAAGAPWGDAAYGGRAPTTDGVLEKRYRWVSAGGAVNLGLSAWVVATRGGLVHRRVLPDRVVRTWTWANSGLLAENTAANLAARHPVERWGLGTVTATASALTALVARSPVDGPATR